MFQKKTSIKLRKLSRKVSAMGFSSVKVADLRSTKKFQNNLHCVKNVRIRSYSGPHFSAFGPNTERYSVSLRIQSGCGKMRTRITPKTDTIYAVFSLKYLWGIASAFSKSTLNLFLLKSSLIDVWQGPKNISLVCWIFLNITFYKIYTI